MKASLAGQHGRADRRRGGPLARVVLAVLFLPLLSGCFRHWLKQQDHVSDMHGAASRYYEEAVGNMASPYSTGVGLEVPDGPPPPSLSNPEPGQLWFMTLHQALEIAMKNSGIVRQLRGDNLVREAQGFGPGGAGGTAYDPAIAEQQIMEELGRFDTNLILNLFWGKDERQLNSTITPTGNQGTAPGIIFREDRFNGRANGLPNSGDLFTLTKRTGIGSDVAWGFNLDYGFPDFPGVENNRFHRASYETNLFFHVRQPLLQGFGTDVNRAPIVIARLRSDQTLWAFKQELMAMVRDVVAKYWELARQQQVVEATDEAIRHNLRVVKELEARVREGPENRIALAQAKIQLVSLRKQRDFEMAGDITRGRGGGLLAVEGQLRWLLGLPLADGRRIVAVEQPTIAPVSYDWDTIKVEALTYNSEIQSRKLAVAEQRQALLVARNGLLPRVDLFARKDFSGLGGEIDDSIDQQTDGAFGSVTVGVQVQASLGYRREAAAVQAQTLRVQQAKDLLRNKAREVEGTLRLNYGQMDLRWSAYQKSLTAVEIAREYRDLTLKLFDEGRFTTRDVLEAINQNMQEVRDELEQRVEYQIALANLELTKGTLFRYHGIHVHEGPWSAEAYPQAAAQAQDRRRAIEWHDRRDQKAQPLEVLKPYDSVVSGDAPERSPEKAGSESAPEVLPPPSNDSALAPKELPLDLRTGNLPSTPPSIGSEAAHPPKMGDGTDDSSSEETAPDDES